jgi:hypothetical protein
VVAASSLLFLVLKLYALRFTVGDEHLYFEMALMVNRGLLPYRDFYFTHPWLHVYVASAVFWALGYSLVVGKLIPTVAFLLGALAAWRLGARLRGEAEAALGFVLLVLSFDPLRISSHFTGVNLTFALAMLGWWLAWEGRAAWSGVAFGAGSLVAVYILPGAGAAALLLLLTSRRHALVMAGVTALVFLLGNGLFWALAGWPYIHQVYVTQFLKGPEGSLVGYRLFHRLGFILYENRALTSGVVAGVVVWVLGSRSGWRRWEEARVDPSFRGLAAVSSWLLLYWVFYASIKVHHAYYFLLVMPAFAWLSALAYAEVVRGGAALARWAIPPGDTDPAPASRSARKRLARERASRPFPAGTARGAAAALVLTALGVGAVDVFYVPYWLNRQGGQVVRHDWVGSPVLGGVVDPVVRPLFWSPTYDPRDPPPGIARYLQHETDHLAIADQLVQAVVAHSAPTDKVFGHTGLAPGIASAAGRAVAANLVDTSSNQLNFGMARVEDWIAAVEADHVRILVVKEGADLMRREPFRAYARASFEPVAKIRDPRMGVYEVLRRR